MLFVFLSVTLSGLEEEVLLESSIFADFSNYHFNSLNGNLNGSRKNSMHGSIDLH